MAEDKSGKKMIAVNREVRHEYFVIEALETGIELVGTEVKSLRAGGVNLKDSWADIDDGELIAKGIHISPYEQGNIFNRSAPPAAFAGTQGRDPPSEPANQAAGIHAGSAVALFQKKVASSWNWACVRAKSCMTSVRLLRRAMPSAILTAP